MAFPSLYCAQPDSWCLQAWLKENPEDEDTARSPRAHVKRSLGPVPRGHTLPQTFFLANDGSMKCTLCSTSGFWEKDDLREHINTHHTGEFWDLGLSAAHGLEMAGVSVHFPLVTKACEDGCSKTREQVE